MSSILKPKPGLRPRWNNNPMAIPPPVAAWVMNEGGGAKLFDLSGNENTGTIDSATWIPEGLHFDATDDYVDCGSDPVLDDLPSFTWCMGVKITGIGEIAGRPLSKLKDVTEMFNDGPVSARLSLAHWDDGGQKYTRATGITHGIWWSIAATYDDLGDRTGHIYKDGIECSYDNQDTVTGTRLSDAAGNFTIGQRTDGLRQFDGEFRYVYIFNVRLTIAQIAYIYQHPYYEFEYPELWELYAAAAAEGPTMPIFDYYYNQSRL